ncbi:site-2 protease family protein [Anaerosphaera multitolerans]|uniref:Site-2 protease family protein n=1 Tax=Anaerosphaera multitolerans TaxID=2487351 RepID=A0A437S7B4_9FIRM|nr:site-2 protease family protein [Anaerosphaera multitolerans]RVU54949.1 site-2 protease family protein [Anaerosphaera multitolerans]
MNLTSLIYRIISLLVAIIPHEVAHGYAAYLLGDDTAKSEGRLSLNPLNHLDPVGLLSMVVLKIGWAKAVPINPYKFKGNRKASTILVSIAGVCANFLMALIFGIAFIFSYMNNWAITPLFSEILWYNVMLGVFNLVPLPPLDGSKVVASLLPEKLEFYFYKYEKYFYFVLIILLFSGVVNRVIAPIIFKIIELIVSLGFKLYGI